MNTQITSFSSVKPLVVLLIPLYFINDQYSNILEKVKEYLEDENYDYEIKNVIILTNQANTEHLKKAQLDYKLEIATDGSKFPWKTIYKELSSINDVYQACQIDKNVQNLTKIIFLYESNYILNEEVQDLEINNLEVSELIFIKKCTENEAKNTKWNEDCEKKLAELYKKDNWETFKNEIIYIPITSKTL
ncbi:9621_t:CDS:1 [Dentiscutata heterogama]|uniref:9621_t:CDS:1 n=1 Tax=Dentiscutata heterogama TaxID=1316150 RepID=A0ACA9JW04_9GLOM|nr:9621_t:CDS:1 [Dentiscutata heterogama]